MSKLARSLSSSLLGRASLLAAFVTCWEYLLTTLTNPEVIWSPVGVAFHALIDFSLALPIACLALFVGVRLARGLSAQGEGSEATTIALVGLVFLLLMLPVTSSRDLLHEELGTSLGFSLAQVQTTVVSSDLTINEATQLCSFAALRDPSIARDAGLAADLTLRVREGLRAALVQQPAVLSLLFLLAFGTATLRRAASTAHAIAGSRGMRLTAVGATCAVALFCVGQFDAPNRGAAIADTDLKEFNACEMGGPVKEYDVHAIDVQITLNRWGDFVDEGFMYALEANIPAIREFEADLAADRASDEGLEVARVSHGLRKDPIQPLVLRANLGECLRVNFTNSLKNGAPASMHILGLPHTAASAGSAIGNNPSTLAGVGDTVTYEIPIPDDVDAERAYYFHDHGDGRARQNMGLFGAIVAEPKGATYLDVETGEELDTETGSNWEAIILDPNVDNRPDGKSFREFVVFYHEIGDEGFTDLRDRDNKKLPLIDDIGGVYRPAARALNYRSEPFRRRLEIEETAKSLGYASYPFGDPATPIPRSYVGEGVKTRLMHGGSEVFHVHHLHGGGDRWRRNPNADPANDFWKGLTKIPDQKLTSIHLDSQSIGPGTSYNLEHECGAGGCQQGVGDFLFHCHIGHHYIAGMWSFWRVFGTVQDEETNLYGRPLAVVPSLFQNPDNDLIAPLPPEDGVSAGELIGLTVDGNRTIVADADFRNPNRQIALSDWIERQLPPSGVPIDKFDATVWNWTSTGAGGDYQVWGEPESTEVFAGYISDTPGERPEVLWNPKNGRYTWPLFRPQIGQRPPFTARHSGAPWLGEEMDEGRLDGLCAKTGVGGVDLGGTEVKRFYPFSAVTMPLQIAPDRVDDDGMIFVLNEERDAILNGEKLAEPLTIRSNVGDCVELILTNEIPDGPLNKDHSKVNLHSHFVQFDTQASDGVITGMSYEQSVRPYANEDRYLTSAALEGATTLNVTNTDRLREGIWIGVGLGMGTCGKNEYGQPEPCTEIRKIESLTDSTITLDRPLEKDHNSGQAVGVEFVRYHWYSDVDFGTVFFHTHVEFKDWDHGLFGTHIVEPKGSSYHDPITGDEIRAGALADIRVDTSAGGEPVAHGVDGSFREFVLYLHDNSPAEGQFTIGGGTINLRAEPWRLREGDAAYRFSSVKHDDPHTPMIRAYANDPVVIRGMGLVERVGGVRVTGHRFQAERYTDDSDTRDAQFIGISERFDVSLEGGAGGPQGHPGDYLYYSTLGRDFESGAWGLLRVHDTAQSDLQPLPGRSPASDGEGFPQLAFTGEDPPSLGGGAGNVCPRNAPQRRYNLVVRDASIVYNELTSPDEAGVVYHLRGEGSQRASTPVVVRANHGDCLVINLENRRETPSSISVGEMVFDPQRSYGSAIGYNYDSTVAPGDRRNYRYYVDRELGTTLALNLGDIDSVEHGAFAAVIVEPEGAAYYRPGTDEPLPAGGAGVQADIETEDGVRTREFVALFNDQDRRIGQNAMPYPVDIENHNGINYTAEPLALRNKTADPGNVFNSETWGDPRHVVTVPAGTPMVYRVAHAWGNQMHVPTLEGHRYLLEPGLEGSEQVYNDALAPGMSIDMHIVGGAGSGMEATGDFLFLDRRQPFMEGGLWNILRVTDADGGASGGDDRVYVFYATASGGDLELQGRTSIRPAGDYADEVTVRSGDCAGPMIGKANVDAGDGAWRFTTATAVEPGSTLCVTSPGGGSATVEVGP